MNLEAFWYLGLEPKIILLSWQYIHYQGEYLLVYCWSLLLELELELVLYSWWMLLFCLWWNLKYGRLVIAADHQNCGQLLQCWCCIRTRRLPVHQTRQSRRGLSEHFCGREDHPYLELKGWYSGRPQFCDCARLRETFRQAGKLCRNHFPVC